MAGTDTNRDAGGICPAVTRHRLPAPDTASMIDWRADFGRRAIIFIDTEEEFDWNRPLARDQRSTSAIAALPAAAARFADHGFAPALMVDHPVVADPASAEAVRQVLAMDGVGLGAQLHPWVNPPFDEALVPANSFPGNLPEALEAAKIDALTHAIVDALGQRPVAYRAGRYGIGPSTARLLAARGYRLDSSVRARYDYRDGQGPDFGGIGNAAYWVDDARTLIELPLTTVFTGMLRAAGPGLYRAAGRLPAARGALARAGLVSRVSLTPEGMPIADVLEAIRIAHGEGERVLAFSFHSPSLAPGHTPYVRDAADLALFWAWWDGVFALMAKLGIRPVGLDTLIEAAASTRPSEAGGKDTALKGRGRSANRARRWGL